MDMFSHIDIFLVPTLGSEKSLILITSIQLTLLVYYMHSREIWRRLIILQITINGQNKTINYGMQAFHKTDSQLLIIITAKL